MYKFNVIKALIGCLMVSVLNADYAGDVYSHAGYKGEKLAINTDISYGEKHLNALYKQISSVKVRSGYKIIGYKNDCKNKEWSQYKVFMNTNFYVGDVFNDKIQCIEARRINSDIAWMNVLSDSFKISELSLPGTHSSATWNRDYAQIKTQNKNIEEQLKNGIRFFDIGLRNTDKFGRDSEDDFFLYDKGLSLGSYKNLVMKPIERFLKENPSELIFMSIRDEGNGLNIDKLDKQFLSQNPFYGNKVKVNNPIGHLRGKIILVNGFDDNLGKSIGIHFNDTKIQDDYELPCEYGQFCMNFLSANYDSSGILEDLKYVDPDKYIKENAKRENENLKNYLRGSRPIGSVYILDFYDDEPSLVTMIINKNYRKSVYDHLQYRIPAMENGLQNDFYSSIETKNVVVKLHEHGRLNGYNVLVNGNIENFENIAFNDKLSSFDFEVIDKNKPWFIHLFEHSNYRGKVTKLYGQNNNDEIKYWSGSDKSLLTIYQHSNYEGRYKSFESVGVVNLVSEDFNDEISSLKIAKGYRVKAWYHFNENNNNCNANGKAQLGEADVTFSTSAMDYESKEYGWSLGTENDQFSCLEIIDESVSDKSLLTIYEHSGWEGRYKSFGSVGVINLVSEDFNDEISSLKIAKGYRVKGWYHFNERNNNCNANTNGNELGHADVMFNSSADTADYESNDMKIIFGIKENQWVGSYRNDQLSCLEIIFDR